MARHKRRPSQSGWSSPPVKRSKPCEDKWTPGMAAPGEFALAVQPEAQLGCFWASHATRAQAGGAGVQQPHTRPSYSDGLPPSAGVELSLASLLPRDRPQHGQDHDDEDTQDTASSSSSTSTSGGGGSARDWSRVLGGAAAAGAAVAAADDDSVTSGQPQQQQEQQQQQLKASPSFSFLAAAASGLVASRQPPGAAAPADLLQQLSVEQSLEQWELVGCLMALAQGVC